MRFRSLVISLFLLPGFGFALSNVTDSVTNAPMLIERHLSGGEPCTIRIQSAGELSITILVNGTEIRIPTECLADLSDCNVPDGVQVADFAEDMFLLLAGGQGDSSWQAKLTINDQRVVERDLKKGAVEPVITRYGRPLDVHEGRISSRDGVLK